jgi:uncharacterized membrane protein
MIDFFKNCNRKQDERPIQIIVQGVGKDELTDALTEAMLRVEEEKERREAEKAVDNTQHQKKETGFLKKVWMIICNKETQSGNKTAVLFSDIMASFFNFFAICSLLFFGIVVYTSICLLEWHTDILVNLVQGFFVFMLLVMALAIALIFRAIANDIKAEKDRNYIVTLFFGFISLASLIVAVVELV